MRNCLLYYILILSHGLVHGQHINGRILDNIRQPIVGAHVLNCSSNTHAHSDDEGRFELDNVALGDTLMISHLGFESREIIINSFAKELQIKMSVSPISLEEVVISPGINALQFISDIDIQVHPVNSSQDVLRQVPGLFIGQHAGGGKAEQIFLRGFDIDHGTDVALAVDGIPVNMVSHAHGQGYADLHFIIPETIEKIDFGKGPYYANQGNFNTAGYVDFTTRKNLDHSTIKLELGQFDTKRLLGMFDLLNSDKAQGYLATEYLRSDGPFESPQHFDRLNLFGTYQVLISESDRIGVQVSHFTSDWDASGQIPQRAVNSGLISRFGAIDNTEGGTTGRTNVQLEYNKSIGNNTFIKNQIFYSSYNFELYSNFTFFLNDPVNGDQIRQKENRSLYGFKSSLTQSFSGNWNGSWNAGMQLRLDDSNDNELSRTQNRTTTLSSLRLGDVDEFNAAGYLNLNLDFGKWRFNPGLRLEYFDFQYLDQLSIQFNRQSISKSIINPKMNVLYNHSTDLQAYVKLGRGFHSNDTRVVLSQNGKEILPGAYGMDIGAIWKPTSRLLLNAAYWYLFLEEEFVYVGDEGIVEPSGQTRRLGVDATMRYQIKDWVFWNFDANYTYAKSLQSPEDANYIPLAPVFTFQTGLYIDQDNGPYAGINIRHMYDRPANESNSLIAKGYTIADLNAGYNFGQMDIGIQIQNLFDTDWNETQFATESRLQNEVSPVEEIHFTPGAPFFIKGVMQFRF